MKYYLYNPLSKTNMAWNKLHKINTKDAILTSAASMFVKHGYDNVSIDQIMKHASLTRGAFYAHFSSKSHLYAESIVKAAKLATSCNDPFYEADLSTFSENYLSTGHRDDNLSATCPLACLITDISQQNDDVKSAYTNVFKGFINNTMSLTGDKESALQCAALMIGGLALARTINDNELSENLLHACQKAINSFNQ